MGRHIALAFVMAALGAHAQIKASELLAHCEATPGGDGFCRGFVEAALDSFILYRDEREEEHYCLFREVSASTDRLVEIATAGLLEIPGSGRNSLNATAVLRDYFKTEKNCGPVGDVRVR